MHNEIPTPCFGTAAFAAPVLSLIACAATLLLVCGLNHHQGFKDVAVVSIGVAILVGLGLVTT